MAYMRGDYHLWADGDEDDGWPHICVRESYDCWDISSWACPEVRGGT